MVRFLFLFIPIFIMSCSSDDSTALKEGDLLFQDYACGPLCDAIKTVTSGVQNRDFSHCGMVVKVDDETKIIEAIGAEVQLTDLKTFLARSGDTTTLKNTLVARIKNQSDIFITDAVQHAVAEVGAPYNTSFLMENDAWYCSELLYHAFKKANDDQEFFKLYPMTFKDPATQDFFPAWVDYYDKLNIPIPEGEPGLNPGSVSG